MDIVVVKLVRCRRWTASSWYLLEMWNLVAESLLSFTSFDSLGLGLRQAVGQSLTEKKRRKKRFLTVFFFPRTDENVGDGERPQGA
jgi:hypothetical protein